MTSHWIVLFYIIALSICVGFQLGIHYHRKMLDILYKNKDDKKEY